MAESQQTADISALPIDKQIEQILRGRLDVQELVSLLTRDTGNEHSLTHATPLVVRKSPTSRQIAGTRSR